MREKNGFALIVTLFTIAVFSFLVLLGYNIVVSERKIASSQKGSVQAYYVTESGVREAIWKLEHDEAWGQNLVDGTLDETLQHSNTVMPDSSYSVSVESIEPGRAQIEAIGYKEQARGTARRVVRVAVTRAIGDSGQNILGQDAFFSGGNITVNGNGTLRVIGAGMYASGNMLFNGAVASGTNLDGYARSVGRITENGGWITSAGLQSVNHPPAPDERETPGIDFDSADPNSLKNRADQTYTPSEFSSLFVGNSTVTLTGITYVTGNGVINDSNKTFFVNGLLVFDGSFTVNGSNNLIVVRAPEAGQPSGLLAKRQITINGENNTLDVEGLVYSLNSITFSGTTHVSIKGALVADGSIALNGNVDVTIEYSSPDVDPVFVPDPPTSPVVEIDHWEESY